MDQNPRSQAQPWAWPDSLDALTAAAGYHFLLLENEWVRVIETVVPAGHTVPLHTHRLPGVQYFQAWSDFIRCDQNGALLRDSREHPPTAIGIAVWAGPLPPHTLENVGTTELRVLGIEVKAAP